MSQPQPSRVSFQLTLVAAFAAVYTIWGSTYLAIRFADKWVAQSGLAVDSYDEAPVAEHLKGQDIRIGVDIGLGEGRATVWTCDLTHGYISINADYRS